MPNLAIADFDVAQEVIDEHVDELREFLISLEIDNDPDYTPLACLLEVADE